MLKVISVSGTARHPCSHQLKSWAELCLGNIANCSAAKQDQDPAATLHCSSRNKGKSLTFTTGLTLLLKKPVKSFMG